MGRTTKKILAFSVYFWKLFTTLKSAAKNRENVSEAFRSMDTSQPASGGNYCCMLTNVSKVAHLMTASAR